MSDILKRFTTDASAFTELKFVDAKGTAAAVDLADATRGEATISAGMLAALADLQPKAAPDEPLTEPVFSKATSTGRGMLAHVERVHDSFLNVRRDLLELRARANARQNQAKSLIDRVCDFLDDYLKPEELRRLGVIDDEAQARPFRLLVAPDLHNAEGVLLRPRLDLALPRPGEDDIEGVKHNDESALFHAGKVVADEIGRAHV